MIASQPAVRPDPRSYSGAVSESRPWADPDPRAASPSARLVSAACTSPRAAMSSPTFTYQRLGVPKGSSPWAPRSACSPTSSTLLPTQTLPFETPRCWSRKRPAVTGHCDQPRPPNRKTIKRIRYVEHFYKPLRFKLAFVPRTACIPCAFPAREPYGPPGTTETKMASKDGGPERIPRV